MIEHVFAIVLIILLILLLYNASLYEHFDTAPTTGSYVKLYEGFEYKDLKYDFQPKMEGTVDSYIKRIIRMNLKSLDINLLPYDIKEFDQLRRVEIYSIFDGENTASSESDFYNSYLDPLYAYRANPAKYGLVAKVFPGQHIKLNVSEPVHKFMLVAVM